ncbi:MAG: hypothetical protein R3C44_15210 [Chloroflexota bacterium]
MPRAGGRPYSEAAIGGGAGLVSCCDIAVAAEETVFAFSEAR